MQWLAVAPAVWRHPAPSGSRIMRQCLYSDRGWYAHAAGSSALGRLVLGSGATATPGTVEAGGRPMTVMWLTITDLGWQPLADA
jgi:hypothetical protein